MLRTIADAQGVKNGNTRHKRSPTAQPNQQLTICQMSQDKDPAPLNKEKQSKPGAFYFDKCRVFNLICEACQPKGIGLRSRG